jgi:hypothetical protein
MGAFKAPYSERLTSELPQLALDFHKSLQRDPYKPIGERMTAHMIDGKALAAELSQGIADATPVPGGVGPMTIACLMLNTLNAACAQNGLLPVRNL